VDSDRSSVSPWRGRSLDPGSPIEHDNLMAGAPTGDTTT